MLALPQSTIGKKLTVALTGLVLVGFVVGHMLGNLQVFAGPEKINDYAALLKCNPALLWGVRIFLLGALLMHVKATVELTRLNRQSRPAPYQVQNPIQSTLPSRLMVWGGVFLFFYILFHISHLTTGTTHPDFSRTDVYSNMVKGFSAWPVSIFYILGIASLGMHLYHGVFSIFQTLGLNHPRINCWRQPLATFTAVVVSLGYISIPIAVLAGILK